MKYVGSKNRLSKEIAPIIQSYIDNMPDCRGYLEPFVGGANMIDKIKCPCKIGNDVHKYLIALLNHVSETTDDEIKEQVEKICHYTIDYTVEEGYEEYTETRYRKKCDKCKTY